MKNIKLLRYASVFLLMIFAFSSVSFGAEDLSQTELDDLISRVEKGDPEAQFKLGLMYYQGQNVKQDYEQAKFWLEKAAKQGYKQAVDEIEKLYTELTTPKTEHPTTTSSSLVLQEINAPLEVNITLLVKEYEDNKFAAGLEYEDKVIRISGTISDIDKTSDGSASIIVSQYDSKVYCFFDKNETASVLNLRKGQQIKIDGMCKFDTTKNILEMYKCRIPNMWTYGTGHEAMIDSIYDVARNLVKGKSPQIQKSATMEAFEGAVDLHLRLWTAEHYAVLMNYEDETWKKGYVVGFWTNDPSLIFAHELKVGTFLSDVQTFYNYQEEGDGTLYFSEDSSEWYSYLARSTVAFAIKDGNVQSIRYVGLMTDIPPEIKQAITGTIVKAEKAPLQKQKPATADEAEKNVLIFENSLEETTRAICWSGRYAVQDSEFIENVMDGIDDYVYMRAWIDEHYIVIRKYYDNSWSSSFTSEFWTDDPEFVFAGNLKVGSSFRDLIMFFGGRGMSNSEENPTEYTLLEEGFWITFNLNDGFISSIEYSSSGAMITSKMLILCNFFRGQTLVAEVTGEKVNVRNTPDTSGKILFQVNRSKGDRLLISNDENNGWHHVLARFSGNQAQLIKGEAYIINRFIQSRPLTNAEKRNLLHELN